MILFFKDPRKMIRTADCILMKQRGRRLFAVLSSSCVFYSVCVSFLPWGRCWGGVLMSSYRVEVPLLARCCGSCVNKHLPPPPIPTPDNALSNPAHHFPTWSHFRPGIYVEYYTHPPPNTSLFPGRYHHPRPRPADSLTQFKKAWMRNVEAVRTQLGQTHSVRGCFKVRVAMMRRHFVSPHC